ncbi:hypothetical protein [Bradyrhizobium elkanii]|uniref:hypothetical protein n=1 Tax=Bradyrhizobium elkanii TaxID=29448 RepID=UPI0035132BE9
MKKLILTIAALVFASAAHAGTTPPLCKNIGDLAEAIAMDRDAGLPQTKLIRSALDADVPLETQRLTITMIEAIYNSDVFVRQPPKKIGAAYLLACIKKLETQRPA